MPATNENQVLNQIENFKNICRKFVELQGCVFDLLEHEEVVTQTWNDLGTDFPALVEADGTVIGEDFTPQQINQAKNKIQDFSDFLQGTAITVSGNPGRNIRRLTKGVI